jgi:hypothetical protein
MPKVRVHNFTISLDGYAAGPDQSLDNPLGVGGTRLHDWAFATRSGRRTHGMDGGDEASTTSSSREATSASAPPSWGATCSARSAGHGGASRGPAGGGMIRRLRAGLIDDLHLVIVPILLGRGERLFDRLDGGPHGYEGVELASSPSVAHVRLSRTTR